ncbi:4-amino-4-deoxy-L-arabinose-phosphoundecaprenol flippase subunit ArnE [archaeon BMS3Abin16]|nr:4-amino-4-deoxy-L-arabinose-phosphoundecaprenol flippase subunit ArnE [archaeon BMS3Abin16]GBE56721.1 4-amino-4-deoxy-L-arabinose-phosphoundecaprenol flippase subunit ArnE [archaeon BMS3Bbin16]HDY74530.1 DMT family transporter [Euryarchaeota archaeon]
MLWFTLSLGSAFFDATYFMLIKRYLKTADFYLLAAGVSLFSFLITMSVSLWHGLPVIGSDFLPYFLASSGFEIVAMILYFKVLQSYDMSLTLPILSFTPVFLVVTSFFILGEAPTLLGLIGILLVVVGSYFLNLDRQSTNALHPFKMLFKNQGTRMMLGVALIWGVETNFIKVAVLNSDPYFTAAAFSLALGAAFLTLAYVKGEPIVSGFRRHGRSFFLAGLVVSISAVLTNIAFTLQIVAYVVSIKRLSVLFSVFYGAILFNEDDFQKRLVGAGIMVLGSVVILLF